jgi:hypothetical protein
LKQGEEVFWGRKARLTKDGLVVHASKLFGKDVSRTVPYNTGLRIAMIAGTCFVFIADEERPFLRVPCSADNFQPAGLVGIR